MEEYISSLYKPQKEARVFEITKYFLEHEMQRGIKKSGVKRIRIHDLRHSHASHLIHMGVPILEVSRRLGHQSPNITLGVYGHLYPDRQKNWQINYKKNIWRIYNEWIRSQQEAESNDLFPCNARRTKRNRSTHQSKWDAKRRILQTVSFASKIEINAGKYQSDRLSVEIRRLREQIEQATEEELKPLLQEIRALLGQLIMILDDNYELKDKPLYLQIQEPSLWIKSKLSILSYHIGVALATGGKTNGHESEDNQYG